MRGKPELPCVPLTQQAFYFVDPAIRQQMDDRYRYRTTRDFIKNTDVCAPKVRLEVLNQAILTKAGQQALFQFTTDPLDSPDELPVDDDIASCTEAERIEIVKWFCDRAEQFVGYVIDQAIETLASIGNARGKLETIEWMFAPDIVGHYIETVRGMDCKVPLFAHYKPMTFQWCCRVHGLSPERFQTAVLEALRVAEADTRLREEHGKLKPGRHHAYRDARTYAERL